MTRPVALTDIQIGRLIQLYRQVPRLRYADIAIKMGVHPSKVKGLIMRLQQNGTLRPRTIVGEPLPPTQEKLDRLAHIADLLKQGRTLPEIAKELGINKQAVQAFIRPFPELQAIQEAEITRSYRDHPNETEYCG